MRRKDLITIAELYVRLKVPMEGKRCGECAYSFKGSCELYGLITNGFAPVNVAPPNDDACGLYSEEKAIDVGRLIASIF